MNNLTYGMVGGSLGSFIGEVHKKAINFENNITLTAGCFSSNFEKNLDTAKEYNVNCERVYKSFEEMAEIEGSMENGIDFVVIVTPNNLHYKIAKAFLENGINVVCEKPLCFEIEEAQELQKIANAKGLLMCLTYTNTGYTMVRVMKEMIENGDIGNVISVSGEYSQGWLIDDVNAPIQEDDGTKTLSMWRKDPNIAGASNCVGDIGSHIENFVSYVTGLKINKLLATVNHFKQSLDLNANILVEYDNGANGAYWCSQVACGHTNDLFVRIYGDKGSLQWNLLQPEVLHFTPKNQATQTIFKGEPYIKENAVMYSRIPSGHTEGLYVAFANIYKEFALAINDKKQGKLKEKYLFPTVEDGLDGVKFIKAVLKSGNENSSWQQL